MMRKFLGYALALVACVGVQAATVNTTLTVTNATGSLAASPIVITGPANLSGIGGGTISANLSVGSSITGPATITLSTGDKITLSLSIPVTVLTSGGTGSATVTGGTGAYAGATGSFPSLSGTGSVSGTSFSLSVSGAGSITTGGSSGGGGSTGGGGGTSTGGTAPTITGVLDAASYTKNIAEGSIFVVKGTNLSAAGYTSTSYPLPTTSGNVKITFAPTGGGASTDAYIVYLYNQSGVNQLAGILPSTVAAGNYNVTVTYNGVASAGFATQVVQRKIGLITADSSGSGLAVIQNYISASELDIDRLTTYAASGFTFSPSRPGQTLIAWAVGMGPVTGGDNVASPGFDFTKNGVNVQVIVGGVTITPLYAGRAPGLAGADQINFQLPANVPTGCTVSFQVSVNGQLSNSSYISIAPDATSSACVLPGFTTTQLQNFDQGGSYTGGSFDLFQISETIASLGAIKEDLVSGSFTKFSGFQLSGVAQYQLASSTSGSCTVTHVTSGSSQVAASGSTMQLDAGTVTISGPSGSNLSNTPLTETSNSYALTIGTEGISIPGGAGGNGKIVAGTYTLKGSGGADVGSFNTSITIGAPLTLTTPLPTTIVRANGLPLSWTGGNATDLVEIIGSASTSTGTGASLVTDSWTFFCTTTAGQGSFTVPASILNQMPAVALSATGVGGLLEVVSSVQPVNFTAPLTAGGSVNSNFLSLLGTAGQVAFQ